MRSFPISGSAYFDGSDQPVILAADKIVLYQNQAMEAFGRTHDLCLTVDQPLPAFLAELEEETVGRMVLAGRDCRVRVQRLEKWTLYSLTEEESKEGIGEFETLRLCGKLRTSIGEAMVGLQALFDDMVETEQLKLEDRFRPVLRQYCRMLRMIGSTELLVQNEDDLRTYWNPAPVSLTEMADVLHRELAPLTHRVTCEAEPGLVVSGDGRLLRQALLNLVANGLQAGGEVSIRMQRGETHALIVVRTFGGTPMEGHSMASLHAKKGLLDLLKPGGLQFGMELCWKIFRMHGGSLALTNRPDGVQVTGRIPLLSEGDLGLSSGYGSLEYDGGISDTLIELSDVLEDAWYSTGEILD